MFRSTDECSVFRRVYYFAKVYARVQQRIQKLLKSVWLRVSFYEEKQKLFGNYLPPKYEYVVFITPTTLQVSIFSKLLQPDRLDDIVQGSTAESLTLMNLLIKVSNSLILLKATADKGASDGSARRHGAKWKAVGFVSSSEHIKDITEKKYVLVSYYTSTLKILEAVTIEDGNWNDGQ
ncbi:hypothetical protein ARMGADRAFT_1086758 [Armillaria gallica]|uniref:Uncharacterized protein n=1 Tax=Armillaria gallica TaxID=47427 RepID=A0A2H3D4F7_ARMGA|nr:hypothetical protein ARMGADRAFT_1086758 [Armillaria gallica]